ncbi:MAG: hypothetical protein ACHQNV_06455 [Vicinamibacteria bacterium]
MSRSRLVVILSLVVVAAGVSAALGVRVLEPARAAVGPLPPEALPLLADARFVMGLDVQRFAGSEFHKRFRRDASARPEAFGELEAKTGLVPERDLDQVFVAGGLPGDGHGVALVLGRFDRSRIARAIETEKKDVSWKDHEGTTVYVFREGSRSPGAMAFLDDRSIVLGAEKAIEAVISRHSGATAPPNAAMVELLARVKPGSTFWMVGDQTLLQSLPKTMPGGGGSITLPALKSLVVNGDLDPVLALTVTGDALDPVAAKSLADIVRGVVGLVSLQASQKPELAQLSSAVSVSTEESRVLVNARLPYDLLDALAPTRRTEPAPATGVQSLRPTT